MPVSVEAFGGASAVLFRGAPSSMWGTAVDNPVVAMLYYSDQGDRRRVAGTVQSIEGRSDL